MGLHVRYACFILLSLTRHASYVWLGMTASQSRQAAQAKLAPVPGITGSGRSRQGADAYGSSGFGMAAAAGGGTFGDFAPPPRRPRGSKGGACLSMQVLTDCMVRAIDRRYDTVGHRGTRELG